MKYILFVLMFVFVGALFVRGCAIESSLDSEKQARLECMRELGDECNF